ITVIRGVETFPGASCRFVRAPPDVSLFLWYSGLVLLFAGPRRWGRAGGTLILLAGLLWVAASPAESDGVQIARESDAAVLMRIGPADPVLVVKDDVYSVRRAVRRLKKEGINRLSAVAVCGAGLEEDAIKDCCRLFSVPRIWMLPQCTNRAAALKQTGVELFFSTRPRWRADNGTVTVDLK
ncbi:MAG TPA: hypothetical protein VJ904_00855, partial [Tichowtungia sp.]|nr:hypothetical protein [Tichowtungia sp.]